MLALGIVVVTLVTEVFLNFMNMMRKPLDESEIMTHFIMIKTISKYIQNGILLLLLSQYITIGDNVLVNGEFNSFSDYWYINIGSEIIWTYFLIIATLNISPFAKALWTIIKRCYDRGCRFRFNEG